MQYKETEEKRKTRGTIMKEGEGYGVRRKRGGRGGRKEE
jgi:hypothetical protein